MTAAEAAAELRVDGTAEPAWLDDLHDALERLWAEVPAVPETDRMLFETAVVEIATNIVRYTTPSGPGPARASARLRADSHALEAELSDDGLAVDVDLDPDPVDDLAEGGRGIALVRRAVDLLTLARAADRNVWTLRRTLPVG